MAQAEQKRSLFGSRSKGKRFTFEGKNTETERLVHGEVVAKDEQETPTQRHSSFAYQQS